MYFSKDFSCWQSDHILYWQFLFCFLNISIFIIHEHHSKQMDAFVPNFQLWCHLYKLPPSSLGSPYSNTLRSFSQYILIHCCSHCACSRFTHHNDHWLILYIQYVLSKNEKILVRCIHETTKFACYHRQILGNPVLYHCNQMHIFTQKSFFFFTKNHVFEE